MVGYPPLFVSDEPPDHYDDPVERQRELHDTDLWKAIEDNMNNYSRQESINNYELKLFVRSHIEKEPDREYLKGEVLRIRKSMPLLQKAIHLDLKTHFGVEIFVPLTDRLNMIEKIINFAQEELNMGD